MQIRIALIPLITYTPPNDVATHNNVHNDSIFDKNIFYYTTNSSRYIIVHDSQFDKRLCLDQMF